MEINLKYAVVTGASLGFGKALATELAHKGYNLILVSLPNEGLEKVALELSKLGVDAIHYEVDLTIKENLLEFTAWVNNNYKINFLINNAGIGSAKKFLESDLNYLDRLVKLNITAPTMIIHQLLPNLLSQNERAYILNVSSMAAYTPIPYKTIYPASKRFVHDFSRGLCQELKDTNVFVSVVHPGAMRTNESVINSIENGGFVGNMGILSPEKAANITLKKLFKGDASILLGWFNNFLWLLLVLLPVRIKMPLLSKSFRKQALSKVEGMG